MCDYPYRWVGIDEAGYGPNLGPLVMTAVVAGSLDDRKPDAWRDLPHSISRAGGPSDRLWIDDSKAIHKPGEPRVRLDDACRAAIYAAAGLEPSSISGLLSAIGAGSPAESEWPLREGEFDRALPRIGSRALSGILDDAPWKLLSIRSAVVGPERFNRELSRSDSKATVHYGAFSRLLAELWESTAPGVETRVNGDKHGGRHYYWDRLVETFADAWIDRGPEGPSLSRYVVRSGAKRLDLSLRPKADSDDSLVALASIVSKSVRELWMDDFNHIWSERLPGLKPTAGYPVDALRFRREIEPHALSLGLAPKTWWRDK